MWNASQFVTVRRDGARLLLSGLVHDVVGRSGGQEAWTLGGGKYADLYPTG